MEVFKKAVHVLIFASFAAYLFLFSFFNIINSNDFFYKEYGTEGTARNMDISIEHLMLSTDTLQDYLNDTRNDIDVDVLISGEKVKMFNESEAARMAVFKVKYLNLRKAMYVFLGISLALSLYSIGLQKTRGWLRELRWALRPVSVIAAVVAIGGFALIIFSFDSVWPLIQRNVFPARILQPSYSGQMGNMYAMLTKTLFSNLCNYIMARFRILYFIAFFAVGIGERLVVISQEEKQREAELAAVQRRKRRMPGVYGSETSSGKHKNKKKKKK